MEEVQITFGGFCFPGAGISFLQGMPFCLPYPRRPPSAPHDLPTFLLCWFSLQLSSNASPTFCPTLVWSRLQGPLTRMPPQVQGPASFSVPSQPLLGSWLVVFPSTLPLSGRSRPLAPWLGASLSSFPDNPCPRGHTLYKVQSCCHPWPCSWSPSSLAL